MAGRLGLVVSVHTKNIFSFLSKPVQLAWRPAIQSFFPLKWVFSFRTFKAIFRPSSGKNILSRCYPWFDAIVSFFGKKQTKLDGLSRLGTKWIGLQLLTVTGCWRKAVCPEGPAWMRNPPLEFCVDDPCWTGGAGTTTTKNIVAVWPSVTRKIAKCL